MLLTLAALFPVQDLGSAEVLGSLSPYGANSVVTADFDGDGVRDLVSVVTDGSAHVSLEVGLNDGTGRVSTLVGIAVGSRAWAVDVDVDGDDDVLLFGTTGTGIQRFMWCENDGGGSFAFQRVLNSIPIGSAADPYGGLLPPTDVDGDGDLDLAFVESDQSIGWIENLPGAAFAPAANLYTVPTGRMTEPRLVDFDADGIVDIVFRATGSARNDWARGLSGGGFAPPQTLTGTVQMIGARVQDLDGDGLPDLVRHAGGQVGLLYVARNLGGGAVAVPTATALSVPWTNTYVFSDADGDGDTDFVFLSNSPTQVHVVRNDGAAGFVNTTLLSLGTAARITFADFDGDGLEDIIRHDRELTLHRNVGGGYGPAQPILLAEVPPTQHAIGVADFDGDGRRDFIQSARSNLGPTEVVITVTDAATRTARLRHIPLTSIHSEAQSCVATDLDGDGTTEALVANRIPATGTGTVMAIGRAGAFVGLTDLFPNGLVRAPSEIATDDVDGDGRVDIALVNANLLGPGDVQWHIASPAGGYVAAAVTPLATPSGHLFTDLDGDGRLDLIGFGSGNVGTPRDVLWYRTLPTGDFAPAVALATVVTDNERNAFDTADVDGDGDLDLVTLGAVGSIDWLENLGGGSFAPPRAAATTTDVPKTIVCLDLDMDGNVDLLSRSNFHFQTLLGDGTGAFAPAQRFRATSRLLWDYRMEAVDLDGDQDEDVVIWADVTWGRRGLQLHRSDARIGLGRCLGQGAASNGLQPKLSVAGSERVADDDITLHVHDLPVGQTGMFAASPDAAFVPFTAGFGTLCLGGSIARFSGPGQILNSGATGRVALPVDLASGPIAAVTPGSTWTFQYWTRDGGTSGFSSAIAVTFF